MPRVTFDVSVTHALKQQRKHELRMQRRATRIRAKAKTVSLPSISRPQARHTSMSYSFLTKSWPRVQARVPAITSRCPKPYGDTQMALGSIKSQFTDFVAKVTPRHIQSRELGQALKDHTSSSLPPQFSKWWDQDQGRYYFYDQASGNTQWDDPSSKRPVSRNHWRRPFEANKSELALQQKLAQNVVAKLDLEKQAMMGCQASNKKRTRALKMMLSWLRCQEVVRVVRSWESNRKDHVAISGTFQEALRAARNLATLRNVAFAWRNYEVASAWRCFHRNYRCWRRAFASVAGQGKNAAPTSQGKKLALLVMKEGCREGARSIPKQRFEKRIAHSRTETLSNFGNWLLAHNCHNWNIFLNGRNDQDAYSLPELVQAGDGYLAFKSAQQKEKADRIAMKALKSRMSASTHWERLVLVLKNNCWHASSAWWRELEKRDPAIGERVQFSSLGLSLALWMCRRAKTATSELARMVQQVAFAAHMIQAGSRCFELKKKRTLSSHELDEAREMFDTYDIDGSGSICTTELLNALSSMGFMATADQVEGLMFAMDDDATGEVEFEEFVQLLESIPRMA